MLTLQQQLISCAIKRFLDHMEITSVLGKTDVLMLQSLDGVGPATILKIGNYLESKQIQPSSPREFIDVFKELNIKKKLTDNELLEELCVAYEKAQEIINEHADKGIGIVTYYDSNYPQILKSTISEDGKVAPPLVLYYKGDLSIAQNPGLAVIGTREITEAGEKAGLYLAQEFAKRGFVIVSGLAVGCDTIGHRGALLAGGKTIAFLAHGLDTIYPAENKSLADEIVLTGGLLLSEYPIGSGVDKYKLVARDRLQAGQSVATLVIQTGVKGGTMHAANTTLMAHKPLFTIWFNDEASRNHEKSLGNRFLVDKGARFIKGSDDLDAIAQELHGLTNQRCQTGEAKLEHVIQQSLF